MGDSTVHWRWSTLPNVHLDVEGGLSSIQPHNVDVEAGGHFAQEFICSINEDHQEFVIRITRKPEAVRTVKVAVKIEGGLSERPDRGVGNAVGNGDGASTFGFTLKISQESVGKRVVEPEVKQTAEELGDKLKDYIVRGLHYVRTKCEAPPPKREYAFRERDSRPARTNQAHWAPNSQQTSTEAGAAANRDGVNSQQARQQWEYGANSQQAQTNQAYWGPSSHQTWTDNGKAVHRDDVNSEQARQKSLQYKAETELMKRFHQQSITRGLLYQSSGESTLAIVGPNDRPGHGTLCSTSLGCNPCTCGTCLNSRQQYGNYPCFCSNCCSSIALRMSS